MTVLNPSDFPLPPGTFGGPGGTQLTVDMMTADPVVMLNTVAKLVATNQGFIANKILRMPGMTVNSFVAYQDVHPQDLFLDPNQDLGPRAPGTEAPEVGSTRRGYKSAEAQSLSGTLRVHDETRTHNKLIVVEQDFQRIANSFAYRLQQWALDAVEAFVTSLAGARTIDGQNWRAAETTGMINSDPLTKPFVDFAKVDLQFIKDLNGVLPDTVLINPTDAFYLRVKYQEKLPAFLASIGNGLTMIQSVLRPEGKPLFLKAGAPGVIAYEEPLSNEYVREGLKKTDAFVFEAKPVFVVNDATAFVEVDGVDS